jgi:DNA-binding CsgD family transcriptional regulator
MPELNLGIMTVVHALYRTVETSAAWPEALDAVAHLSSTDAVSIHRLMKGRLVASPMAARGYNELLRQRIPSVLIRRHPLLAAVGTEPILDTILTDGELPTRSAFTDTSFFMQWMAPQRFTHCALALINSGAAGTFALEIMCRHPFGNRLAELPMLLPRIGQALHLAHGCDRLPPMQDDDDAEVHHKPSISGQPSATTRNAGILAGLPEDARLKAFYGLTKAEGRIAKLIVGGLSLDAVADRLEISVHTARKHLHNLYEKTDTARQFELMALLQHGPARLSAEPTDSEVFLHRLAARTDPEGVEERLLHDCPMPAMSKANLARHHPIPQQTARKSA